MFQGCRSLLKTGGAWDIWGCTDPYKKYFWGFYCIFMWQYFEDFENWGCTSTPGTRDTTPLKCFHCRFRDSNVDFDTEIATPQESSSEICITYDGIHKHRQRLVNSQVSVHNYPISLFTDNKIHKKAKKRNVTEIWSSFVLIVSIRPAHFSHFSREREMVLRDISREKCGARNCEKNQPNVGQLGAQVDQKLTIFQVKSLTFWNRLMYHFYLLLFSPFDDICHTSIKYIF